MPFTDALHAIPMFRIGGDGWVVKEQFQGLEQAALVAFDDHQIVTVLDPDDLCDPALGQQGVHGGHSIGQVGPHQQRHGRNLVAFASHRHLASVVPLLCRTRFTK